MTKYTKIQHDYCELFDIPLKDYTIIANDGQKIHVHKLILWSECDMFKTLFSRTELKQEDFIQTTYSYDSLLLVVKLIYGFSMELTNDVYEIADYFMIQRLLNWRLYITVDNDYVYRFIDIENNKIVPSLVEKQNYLEIYDAVMDIIAKTCYYTVSSEINCECVYTKQSNLDRKLKNDMLLSVTTKMLKSWIMSRNRINNEDDVVYILECYIDRNPEMKDVVENELIPLVNVDLTNTLQYGLVNTHPNKYLAPTYPVTYFQLLTQFKTNEFHLLQSVVLPDNYEGDSQYIDFTDIDFDDEDNEWIYTTKTIKLKDISLYYRVSSGDIYGVQFTDIIKDEHEYKELLAVKDSFEWNQLPDIERNISLMRQKYGVQYKSIFRHRNEKLI